MRLSLKVATVTASLIGATAFAIVPASAAPAQTASAAATCYVHNNSSSALNVRSGAGPSYSVIGTIAPKGKLPCGSLGEREVTGGKYTACGGTSPYWMTVRINGVDGWVASACVSLGL
ncbi:MULTISPECIES: SH3 domain-containing protein [Streptomyces]|uniref:SH3 domain-containing protein n=1 Tax=Streptomyces TaxID=1883 RepID=UPI00167BE13E|nr:MULTISPECIES: SH3 domain-containing protein [Streptomyces]MBK3521807.1 SH3 domain-containing protein [Streptomyces sp. MBT70]GGR79679.1 hypothetical protein GCM10010236_37940 [Streptomyces eurythermus]